MVLDNSSRQLNAKLTATRDVLQLLNPPEQLNFLTYKCARKRISQDGIRDYRRGAPPSGGTRSGGNSGGGLAMGPTARAVPGGPATGAVCDRE